MPVSCEYCVARYRSLRWADQTSRSPTECGVSKSDREASKMMKSWTRPEGTDGT